MKKVFLAILFCLFLVGCSNSGNKVVLVSGDEARDLIKEDAILVDVRSLGEYNARHLDGAVLMSVDTIDKDVALNVIGSYDKKVIVYCRSGARSSEAAKMLVELGYKNVYDLGSIDNF